MKYKTGEEPQKNDEVLGEVDGKAARGRVMALLEDDQVRISRRAPYAGEGQPLPYEFHDVPAADLTLIYRPRAAAAESGPKAASGKAKVAARKEAARK